LNSPTLSAFPPKCMPSGGGGTDVGTKATDRSVLLEFFPRKIHPGITLPYKPQRPCRFLPLRPLRCTHLSDFRKDVQINIVPILKASRIPGPHNFTFPTATYYYKVMSDLKASPTSSGRELEKEEIASVEVPGKQVPLYKAEIDVSGVDEKKLLRKIDLALIPWLSLLYLLSFLDRTSIGNYALFEVPSNVFLKRLRPSIWLSFLMLGWGIMMTIQGLVVNFGGLMGMRWMLGLFEAGLFPGVNYYLSCWYKRSEFGIRAAIFFSAASVSGAFGGLLAAAISNMDGIGGKPGWAWIFKGLATVLAGVASFWIIQDFPDTAKFLTEAERTVVVRRLQSDDQFSAAGGEKLQWKYILKAVKDWKTWVGSFMATPANLLTVPVYAFAGLVTCGVGYIADRIGHRGYLNMTPALSYFAVYMATCGIYPVIPNTIAWVSNNVEGSYKRSVVLAMVIGFGNLNGGVTSNVYRAPDKPWYTLGHGLVLMYIGFGIISSIAYQYFLKKENARRERGERDEIIGDALGGNEKNGRFATVADAKMDKGDEWSGYRYTT
ncbi:hypothetical protein DXG01_010191, partial [Tephrocybe rancida]